MSTSPGTSTYTENRGSQQKVQVGSRQPGRAPEGGSSHYPLPRRAAARAAGSRPRSRGRAIRAFAGAAVAEKRAAARQEGTGGHRRSATPALPAAAAPLLHLPGLEGSADTGAARLPALRCCPGGTRLRARVQRAPRVCVSVCVSRRRPRRGNAPSCRGERGGSPRGPPHLALSRTLREERRGRRGEPPGPARCAAAAGGRSPAGRVGEGEAAAPARRNRSPFRPLVPPPAWRHGRGAAAPG